MTGVLVVDFRLLAGASAPSRQLRRRCSGVEPQQTISPWGKVVCSRQPTPATRVLMSWQLPDWAAEALQADTVTSKLGRLCSIRRAAYREAHQTDHRQGQARSTRPARPIRPGIVIDGIITPLAGEPPVRVSHGWGDLSWLYRRGPNKLAGRRVCGFSVHFQWMPAESPQRSARRLATRKAPSFRSLG
jgi:hypothetical protein